MTCICRRRRRQSSLVRDRRVGCNFWIINFLTTGVAHISCSRRRSSCSDHLSCWSPVSATSTDNTASNTHNDNDWQTYAYQTKNHSYYNTCDCVKRKTPKIILWVYLMKELIILMIPNYIKGAGV